MRCRTCRGENLERVLSGDAVRLMCVCCGALVNEPVRFTRWCGDPVHMVDPRWSPAMANWSPAESGLRFPVAPVPTLTVWCGPPAPRPYPPTPEQLLAAALGIEVGW